MINRSPASTVKVTWTSRRRLLCRECGMEPDTAAVLTEASDRTMSYRPAETRQAKATLAAVTMKIRNLTETTATRLLARIHCLAKVISPIRRQIQLRPSASPDA